MGATKSAIGDLIAHFDSTVAESDMVTDQ